MISPRLVRVLDRLFVHHIRIPFRPCLMREVSSATVRPGDRAALERGGYIEPTQRAADISRVFGDVFGAQVNYYRYKLTEKGADALREADPTIRGAS